ncbi:MAG: rod shape-determining protein MreC [Oscillospiraceae bacterium]|nr:rod shape-determining protein MreC [Oscillospiraceae bacterium]MBR7073507.1 rod shape-determining protein MreC [Oscillospiraceae bacterium]
MKEYLRKNGLRVGIIVAAAALIIGLGAATRDGRIGFVQNLSGILKSPIQKVLSSAVNWFDSMYGYLYEYDSLMAENESLRSQLADAQKSARDGIEASEENTRLRKLLELREKHTDYVMESCKVVLWSSSNWSSAFTISKGSASGIELGDPVITEYGAVVGQITELGTNWATVSTVIDVDMSVGAFVGATGNSGMVVGEYAFMRDKTAKLTYLADGAQIFVGDDVLTSGSGGAFPAGLMIGTLTAVQTEAGGQIEYGIVEPQANLDSLVQVFVIKDFTVVE